MSTPEDQLKHSSRQVVLNLSRFFGYINRKQIMSHVLWINFVSKNERKMRKDGLLHVVLLPWSAFGHLMPFYQLSLALAKAGVKVSFVSTPKNIQRLPEIPSTLSNLISFLELPLPVLEEGLLPQGAEATVDIPFEKVQFLKTACDLLELPFKNLVVDLSPDWIFIDFFHYWVVDIARELNIPLLFYSCFSAATLAFLGSSEFLVGDGQKRLRSSPASLLSPPEWFDFPSSVSLKVHEAIPIFNGLYVSSGTDKTDAQRLAMILDSCQAVAARTCVEYESNYLNSYRNMLKKPVIPIGLLPSERHDGSSTNLTNGSWGKIFKWLDEQETKSVVFVSFGSECKLSKNQIFEIAYGLELSKVLFLWALKKPSWANNDLDALPSGFRDRTGDRGVVTMEWAPQKEILAHASVGGSLFHSGWGSVIETLQFGHSLVVLPFIYDQPLNARLLVEKELAIEIERGEDGSFSRDGIAKSLKLAMMSEDGDRLRARAKEVGSMVGNHKLHQDFYIGEFVEFLKNGSTK